MKLNRRDARLNLGGLYELGANPTQSTSCFPPDTGRFIRVCGFAWSFSRTRMVVFADPMALLLRGGWSEHEAMVTAVGKSYRGPAGREEETMTRPQPIREIAPPAWPLPLIAIEPRGTRRGA